MRDQNLEANLLHSSLKLINNLFKGRSDVFALYWRKGKKSGYMPAYWFDPYHYRLHKLKGGTFQQYADKTYLPLTDEEILKHLRGEQLIGIYPLLKNNTSYFIAADFDGENWIMESRKFMEVCEKRGIPAYLERSRSGNGGHVWIFFEQAYPAVKSRKVMKTLLKEAGIGSVFDKQSSFDRLFPNQDYLSGKGLGNLIALPFHKPAMMKGNSCFVNPETDTLEAYPDQWAFLSAVKKVPVRQLDVLFESMETLADDPSRVSQTKKLQIILKNNIRMNRSGMRIDLVNFLKKELVIANTEYFIKKKSGKSTWNTKQYFKCIEETEAEVVVPKGFTGRLLRYCKKQEMEFEFLDKRVKHTPVNFSCNASLRTHQHIAPEAASQKDFGIITAPPGSGKTVIGLQIIADKKQPALIIVHRKQLLEQWIERIEHFLGIPKNEIGRIGQGKARPGKMITVAMIQSLRKFMDSSTESDFADSFGTVIIDECHHIPAETYRAIISGFSTYYQYGLTATPFRKGTEGKLLFIYLGDIIAEIKPAEIEQYRKPRIVIRNTSLDVPYNSKTDAFETLSNILIHDVSRNQLIINDVKEELRQGKKAVIITERRQHIETLNQFLKQTFETITLSGDDPENSRARKWGMLRDGHYQVLITTGQFFGEGSDLQSAACLFLAYPFSFKGKLIQYIGRVQRSEITPVIYDYRDSKIDYLDRLFLNRNKQYRHFDRQATLFDETASDDSRKQGFIIEKTIKIPISELDFRFGTVAFDYSIPEKDITLSFEVENDSIRPEFDVLKPYFAKALKKKSVCAEIYAEFEGHELVAQSAGSADLDRINREIIDSVKFRFVNKNIIGRRHVPGRDDKTLMLSNLQDADCLFDSEEELLNEILNNKHVKHYRHLRYLAVRHEGSIMKLRFVLQPFSFVFLISGEKEFHLVLETLDTEEATYLWHFDKDLTLLRELIVTVDRDLQLIRNKGRHAFLATPPDNFSKIVHEYTDERKGFMVWKDMLEERVL